MQTGDDMSKLSLDNQLKIQKEKDDLDAARRAQEEKDARDAAAKAALQDGRDGSGDGNDGDDEDGKNKNLLTDGEDKNDDGDADGKKKRSRTGPLVPDTIIGKLIMCRVSNVTLCIPCVFMFDELEMNQLCMMTYKLR